MIAIDLLKNTIFPNLFKTNITKLTVLGDSLSDAEWSSVAEGKYYKQANPRNHWTKILERELGIEIINHGYAGDSAYNIAYGPNTRIQDCINTKPDHFLLMIGGNDIYGNQTAEQTMESVKYISEKLLETGAELILMWCPIYANETVSNPSIPVQLDRLSMMPSLYRSYADQKNLKFIDVTKSILGNDFTKHYLPDKVHPNTLGQVIIANYILYDLGIIPSSCLIK